uniref:Uncharacterized protein n=1 Tax=Tanacetum cinerariifolium TaxID=118510 RepID=A0A6L2JGN0_TANCI|nr:hypothetical protein [Tanacetum cinerariifolium]
MEGQKKKKEIRNKRGPCANANLGPIRWHADLGRPSDFTLHAAGSTESSTDNTIMGRHVRVYAGAPGARSHSGIYGRRFGINRQNTSNDMSGERHDMIEDDTGNTESTLMMSFVRPSSHSHAGVWSRGHTWGETNACCFIMCRYNSPSAAEDLLGHWKMTGARNCFNIHGKPNPFTRLY